ncbi:cytochrome P450 71A1-like [Senna tora]|uniref:Cytochrome P450 71A1-like n=1 Tax=Senna tora TaxID=362788 RepID=A0A835CGR2_9FABA|nr:cytochrome P450 71A1-like [Senna tora]
MAAFILSSSSLLFFSSLLCFLIFASFLFKLINAKRITKSPSKPKINLPPSPPKLPIIGNLHQLGPLPHVTLRTLSKKYGPILYLELGHSPTVVVSSPELASEVMKTHDVAFANRPKLTAPKILLYGCTDVGFGSYGELWREKKKICGNELLNQKRVQSFRDIRDEEVGALLRKIRDLSSGGGAGGCVNLSELLIGTTNDIVSRCVLGDKFNTKADGRLVGLVRKVMVNLAAFSVGDYFPSFGWVDSVSGLIPRVKAIFKELDEFFDKVIEEHRVKKGKSFVGILLQLQENGMLHKEITEQDFKPMLMDMFVGGTDTTSTVMQWGMAQLVRNPTKLKKAQEEVRRVVESKSKSKVDESDISEMKYLRYVVKEIVRLHPPAPLGAPRIANTSVEINGYTIPAHTTVYINSWAIQRDSKFWENGEEFIPERFEKNDLEFRSQNFNYIPFGSGRRGCPGMIFGLASLECMLANLLYSFDWKLPDSVKDVDMSESFGLTISKKVPLYLHATPYSPN